MTTSKNPHLTVLTISIGFTAIFLGLDQEWAIWVAIGVGLPSIFSGGFAKIIDKLWMGLGHVLSLIVPKITLAIVYFLILCPIAFLSRVFGKSDPLQLKKQQESLWVTTDKAFTSESFKKPW